MAVLIKLMKIITKESHLSFVSVTKLELAWPDIANRFIILIILLLPLI